MRDRKAVFGAIRFELCFDESREIDDSNRTMAVAQNLRMVEQRLESSSVVKTPDDVHRAVGGAKEHLTAHCQ